MQNRNLTHFGDTLNAENAGGRLKEEFGKEGGCLGAKQFDWRSSILFPHKMFYLPKQGLGGGGVAVKSNGAGN